MAEKIGKKLTQKEKDEIDEKLIAEGGSPWIIERKGRTYELKGGKLVPLSGNEARAAIKRGKKTKKLSK